MDNHDIVFDEVQIGRGIRPVAQHGFVVISPKTISLLGSSRQPIDSAPISEITAGIVRFTRGQTVAVTMNAKKYNLSPGWGARPGPFILPGETSLSRQPPPTYCTSSITVDKPRGLIHEQEAFGIASRRRERYSARHTNANNRTAAPLALAA
ncbi:MAG: hypothetical protein ACREP9_09250 [Candidatus Dormibacteraceae bacterium]